MSGRGKDRAGGAKLRGKRATYWLALVVGLCIAPFCAAEPRTLVLHGPVTNTTEDGATANVSMTLTVDGEKVTGEMRTEPPLVGTGKLEGRMVGAWCEVGGEMAEGYRIQFRGVVNGKDFRGTYVAAVPGEPVQYGKFQLAVAAAAK